MLPAPHPSQASILKHQRMAAVLSRLEQGFATAAMLSEAAGTCERTVYRYVDELRAAGQPIIGQQGAGYMLRRRPR